MPSKMCLASHVLLLLMISDGLEILWWDVVA